MKLVAYLRVSTEDKGQDPERQGDVLRAWAMKEGHELVGFITDLGTSGATPPMTRPKIKEAVAMAKNLQAEGIAVEAVDRWTRGGIEALMVSRFFMRLDHGLNVRCANSPTGLPPGMEDLWDSINAMAAQAWLDRHRQAVKTGYDRARKLGFPNGRPGPKEKDPLTREELDFLAVQQKAGKGWRVCANEISKLRGAYDVADPKAQRQRRVGPTWLRAEIARIAARGERRDYANLRSSGVNAAHPRDGA